MGMFSHRVRLPILLFATAATLVVGCTTEGGSFIPSQRGFEVAGSFGSRSADDLTRATLGFDSRLSHATGSFGSRIALDACRNADQSSAMTKAACHGSFVDRNNFRSAGLDPSDDDPPPAVA